ncbi:MAG: 4Fe-4S dicluster domain-containing protein [Bacillota bacterium]
MDPGMVAPKTAPPPVAFNDKWCKKCGICIRFCPVRVLEAGPSGVPRLARPDECTYCGLCENLCPDYAAVVGRRPKKRGDGVER